MRIIIESTAKEPGNKLVIIGNTDIGKIKGNWISPIEPKKDQEYNVELSFPTLMGETVSVIKKDNVVSQTSIGSDSRVYFQGICEVVDDEEIYVVRFAMDWIEMLDIESAKINVDDVVLFSVPSNQLQIHPY